MTTYIGYTATGNVKVEHGNLVYPLNPRLHLANHSPTGFAWGHAGSGPAQLALAILCDHLGDDKEALELYQEFKFIVIAGLPMGQDFALTGIQIATVVEQLKEKS